MGFRDANPEVPEFSSQYELVEVDIDYLARAVKPKSFIHIDQTECITCENCVDICPWSCIWMLSPDVVESASNTEQPGTDPADGVVFVIDDDVCTRCALCVDRCPTGVITLGKLTIPGPEGDPHARNNNHGYGYGMRL